VEYLRDFLDCIYDGPFPAECDAMFDWIEREGPGVFDEDPPPEIFDEIDVCFEPIGGI
jgi:hypothetical protein